MHPYPSKKLTAFIAMHKKNKNLRKKFFMLSINVVFGANLFKLSEM